MKIRPLLLVLYSLSFVPLIAEAIVPDVSEETRESAEKIHSDPKMQKLLEELTSPAGQKWRFDNQMELVRIASPSRSEMRRQAEIKKRLIEKWGFSPSDVFADPSGKLPGAGVQLVDDLPVYNVCARIQGTYPTQLDAVSFNGQFPKVLLEGHIDTVNPPDLPPEDHPYEPIKLQKVSKPIVKSREELAMLPDELHFDDKGKIIEDEQYHKAYKRYQDREDALIKKAYRIYVPGYNDAMINTTAVLQAAVMLKKLGIKPVYDVWVCGTAGEEGKGNLAGMKQLYGYNQVSGKGNNALNFVANIGADSTWPKTGTINYLGSYRFEVKYFEKDNVKVGSKLPSALMAMNRAIASIADIKTSYDVDKAAERTTYTVGVAKCSKAPEGYRSKECTVMVDMRSPTQEPLNFIRSQIEPKFRQALEEENEKFGLDNDSSNAVKMELVWFGDRPAHQREDFNDPILQAYWQSADTVGIDRRAHLSEHAVSLNDNVPAAVGVPTININVGTNAGGGGGHTWYEWGVPGDGVSEGKRLYRMILMGLMAAGYNTSDGKVVKPLMPPIGNRTTEEVYK